MTTSTVSKGLAALALTVLAATQSLLVEWAKVGNGGVTDEFGTPYGPFVDTVGKRLS